MHHALRLPSGARGIDDQCILIIVMYLRMARDQRLAGHVDFLATERQDRERKLLLKEIEPLFEFARTDDNVCLGGFDEVF